jgi:hypothetical protein
MARKINYERAAGALVRADSSGDGPACTEYGIAPRTLRYYRARLHSGKDKDKPLLDAYRLKHERACREWAEESKAGFQLGTAALKAQFAKVQADAEAGKPINHKLMGEVRAACAMFAEINFTNSAIANGEDPMAGEVADKDTVSNFRN